MKKKLVTLFSVLCVAVLPFSACVKKKNLEQRCKQYASERGYSKQLTAPAYNSLGLRFYEQKEYKKAADLFRCSIQLNNSYQVTHYNLACMLSLQYGQGDKTVKRELFRHLAVAVKLDPVYFQKIKTDSDFDPVRELPEFKAILKMNTNK